MFIDSHCHLTDERLAPEAEQIISSMPADGLDGVITVGYDRESSLAGLEIAAAHERVWCTLGVHPHDADKADERTYEEFRTLASDAKVVGIGEIGLDYYYDLSPRDVQREVFARQIRLAHECALPVCLHVADPDNFWDPKRCPPMAFERNWFYGDGTFPTYESLYEQTYAILDKHPNLHAMFAHAFFLSEIAD